MVKGLNVFREYFFEYKDNYILIGGAACDQWFNETGVTFRPTRDLDVILIIEALTEDFVRKFWDFILEGKYEIKKKCTGEKKVYRFRKPSNKNFPYQIELFSRKPDILGNIGESHLTPIPVDGDISSLSAILMNDDYYSFTINHSIEIEGLKIATAESLICLKARAYLDNVERQKKDGKIKKKDIEKHKTDVFQLATTLDDSKSIALPMSISNDVREFLDAMRTDPPDYNEISQFLGSPALNGDELMNIIKEYYKL